VVATHRRTGANFGESRENWTQKEDKRSEKHTKEGGERNPGEATWHLDESPISVDLTPSDETGPGGTEDPREGAPGVGELRGDSEKESTDERVTWSGLCHRKERVTRTRDLGS